MSEYLNARSLEMGGDAAGAAALYEQAAARGLPYTRMADVLNSAARCRIALKDPGRAESLARQALEKDPGFWPALHLGERQSR